jgi:hypothetical protein
LEARLDAARLALQVDVGFGDAVTPAPQAIDYPTLLPMPAPRLRVYPREAVIGEKLHAMIDLGLGNSRMKDFFDIWFLSKNFDFDGRGLAQAVRATFDRRDTSVPSALPVALTQAFAEDRGKQTQWTAFLARARLASSPISLADVVHALQQFLEPVLATSSDPSRATAARWSPQRGWIRWIGPPLRWRPWPAPSRRNSAPPGRFARSLRIRAASKLT